MKIGYAQFAPLLGDHQANVRKLEALSPSFRAADLVVLPELSNSGYNFESPEQAQQAAEEIGESPFVQFLEDFCRSTSTHVVSGFCEREGKKLYNTSLLIGPEGLVGKYRKMHLFVNEMDYFQPGDLGLPIFTINDYKLGMLICFDWVFPEAWRVLALKGADIICHPSNLVLPGFAQRAVPVCALMNRLFVVTANRIGRERELTFTGMSIMAAPDSRVLAQASSDREEVTLVDIDVAEARNKMITARNHLLTDRRPEEYTLICDRSLARPPADSAAS